MKFDESRIDIRIETGYLDIKEKRFDKAVQLALKAKKDNKSLSIGLLGNAAELFKNF